MTLVLTSTLAGCIQLPVLDNWLSNTDVLKHDDQNESPDNLESDTNSQKTVMDLFKGEQRLWYAVDADTINPPAHNTKINMVLVTENSKTIGCYYYVANIGETPLVLADLDGLSDAQILELALKHYHDGRQKYVCTDLYVEPILLYNAISLPYEINYSGTLDKTGNQLRDEDVKFYDAGFGYSIPGSEDEPTVKARDTYSFIGYSYSSNFPLTAINKTTVVKNKEYLTFTNLITLNNDPSFESVVLDSPEGATEVR